MTRTAPTARLLSATVTAAAVMAFMLAAPSPVVGQGADPFTALSVQRPPQPVAAPDFVFVTAEGREARLGDLRGRVVFLGFFATT